MTSLLAAISAVAGLATLNNWRHGFFVLLLVGVLQDVLRKLTPGVPAYYILWSAAVFMMIAGVAIANRRIAPVSVLYLHNKDLAQLWGLLTLLVAAQAIHAFIRWGPLLPVLGAVEYVIPIVAVLVGVGFAQKEEWVTRFMVWYVAIAGSAALTVWLSYWLGDTYAVLREIGSFVGSELIIYDVGTAFESYSGLFRVGEVAAWHAATSIMFLVILGQSESSLLRRFLIGAAIVLLIGAIVLTGRRKMLVGISIFVVGYVGILMALLPRWRRFAIPFLLIGVIGSFAFSLGDFGKTENPYAQRGATSFADSGERFETALDLMDSAITRSDGIGLGLGVYSQGKRYAGIDLSSVVGGAGEAGIGKAVLELGLAGLVLIAALFFLTTWTAWKVLARAAAWRSRMVPQAAGFLSFVIAQLAVFTIATQIFGDPFVLIITGTVGGFSFALLHKMSQVQSMLRAEATNRQMALRRRGLGTEDGAGYR